MVAPVLVAAGIGAGMGLLKQREQRRQFEKAAELAATQTSLSPFNPEIQPGQIGQAPSAFQNVLQGALAGAGFAGKNPSLFGGAGGSDGVPSADTTIARQEVAQANAINPSPAVSEFRDPNILAAGTGEARVPEQISFDTFENDPRQRALFENQSQFAGVR